MHSSSLGADSVCPTSTAPRSADFDAKDLAKFGQRPYRFYFRRKQRVFALGVLCLFFTNLLDCLYPLAIKSVIDRVEAGSRSLLAPVMVLVGLMLAVAIFRYYWRIYFGLFQHSAAEELRLEVFRKFSQLGPSFYQSRPVGELMSLISNDINSFRMALGGGVLVLLDALFLIMVIVPLMLTISVSWTWQTLIFLPLLPFLIQRLERLIHERFKRQQEKFAELSGCAQEIVSGIRVIKGFAQEPANSEHFDKYSRGFERACNQSARVESAFQPCMEFAVATGSVILLWLGSDDVMTKTLSIGSFFAFHRYIAKMVWPMTAIGIGVTMVQQGRASVERLIEFLLTPTDIPNSGKMQIGEFSRLEVRNLYFRYKPEGPQILRDVSFELKAGETLGLVGSVGAGKSTLLQLLCRLYPVERGMIFVNGIDINDIELGSLRQLISLVPQESFLFSETVRNNLQLGLSQEVDAGELRQYVHVVGLNEEISQLSEGYDSYLGERGVNLSGGQKQRLTIARALIRHSPVIALDDSLSAVDATTERAILDRLASTLSERQQAKQTTIVVSHKLGPLERADRIVVLNSGQVEAIGTAAALSRASGSFRRLQELQRKSEVAEFTP